MTRTETRPSAAAALGGGVDLGNGRTRLGLSLRPIDTLFFRDGKPFGASSVLASGLPQPQTLAGAVATALIAHFKAEHLGRGRDTGPHETRGTILARLGVPAGLASLRCRGPWLLDRADESGAAMNVLVPAPADLVHNPKEKGSAIRRLIPADAARFPARPGDGLRPLWWAGEADDDLKPVGGFLKPAGLRAYLAGGKVEADQLILPDGVFKQLYALESKVGIAIDPDSLAAAESMIYALRFLRLRPGVRFYAEIEVDSAAVEQARLWLAATPTLTLGGEGKRVALSECAGFAWPEPPPGGPAGRHVRLLTAPAFFGGKSPNLPPDLFRNGAGLAAAAVPGQVAVSGWDLARHCPKPTRYFAPAGSVFYFDSGGSAGTWADEQADAPLGYGTTLKGNWPSETPAAPGQPS